MAMANHPHPLPVVEVSFLHDVENLATDGGPRRIVLVHAESLDHARAMLSAFRAKGLLGTAPHRGRGELFRFNAGSCGSYAEDGLLASDYEDVVACGWEIEHIDRLLRADELGSIVDVIAADSLRHLLRDPEDRDTLRDVRFFARIIRGFGKETPGLMGQAPVTLGNYLQNVVTQALKRGGPDRRAWVDERRGRMLGRLFALSHYYPVSFNY